jgi:two-component sensor histidine kinase/integral membrane sensor domain MASE1
VPELSSSLARCPAAFRELGLDLLLTLCYLAAAQLGLKLVPDNTLVAAIWPPSGVALAGVLIFGVRVWPSVALGALIVALAHGNTPLDSLGLAAAGTAAALLGWWLLTRFRFGAAIERVRDVILLLAVALLTATVCPTAGCPLLVAAGRLHWEQVPSVWLEWSAADTSGILLIAPLVLTWLNRPGPKGGRKDPLALFAFLLAMLLVSTLTFPAAMQAAEPRYLLLSSIFPLLIWGALQFGTCETLLGAVIVSVAAIVAWRHGSMAFPAKGAHEPSLVINLFIAEVVGTALLLGAITTQRRRAYDELERRVAERTAELGRSNDEKELLLKEIHHRVKNNMQVICSLLNLEARSFNDARIAAAFADSQYRVKSMALVHEHLYQSRTLGRISMPTYLRALVDGVARSQPDGERVRCDVQSEDITMPLDTAVPCGLIVNEIVTNVFKHAFPAGRGGHLTIALRHGSHGEIELLMSDDGVGLPCANSSLAGTGFGMRLIALLVEQLQARLELLPTPGTTMRLIMPQAASA